MQLRQALLEVGEVLPQDALVHDESRCQELVPVASDGRAIQVTHAIVFGGDEWDVLEDIPNDSAAALILLEHHWAVPLRDAIARANGFRISDGFISPLDLVGIGLMTAEEAKDLHAMETSGAAKA